jgi:prevent-host-death family protein
VQERLRFPETAMPTYGVVEARKKLSSLLAAAMRGEAIILTRRGRPVVVMESAESLDGFPSSGLKTTRSTTPNRTADLR